VLVVGLARDDTLRRIYEDEIVARLLARGTRATQSHALVPGSLGSDAHERLTAAARKAGARYLLSTAVIGQDREVVVTTRYGGAAPMAIAAGMATTGAWRTRCALMCAPTTCMSRRPRSRI
jgi:hypothetical protein